VPGRLQAGKECFDMREWEQKYDQHKHRAGRRGIPFELTFKQWLKIWQDSRHLHERGHRQGQYVMARFFGRGSYKIGNVRDNHDGRQHSFDICGRKSTNGAQQSRHKAGTSRFGN
jgi:hypothetical protein